MTGSVDSLNRVSQASLVDELKSLTQDAGIDLTDHQLNQLVEHLLLVIEKNASLNLTRITSPTEALVLHILDSLLLADACSQAPDGRYLDMGTGAGFPGIPLRIVSARDAVLLDSVGKKVAAVQEFCDQLHLDRVECVHARLEDYAVEHLNGFAVITARAVASLPVLIEYATPLLQRGGLFVAAKARPEESELEAGDRAADICGLRRVAYSEFELPNELGHRTVIVYQSVSRPSCKLPRQAGAAKRHPLG
ncbi:16S rRNA (guanine(527)-N(7))-methyltransferase RsmG [Collinsella sp. An2]|uniref:16S rRNA (guanine(527)-N(7))-methyltransferase RsmG n=1 Tax=Collinsella sp. An2 TaxID=1965585 RepID=UPI000B369822|nr:16S rRNA (guanine(527)-N(7))-methyltransferase RsmG [Collinsella sp. An2]OUP10446.1 16S rRNA (guanine(527)-N(7))-methyltransferase RsmG [Collinsella sp. An2]